ncbi:MAG: hypothetical protein IIB57_00020 [Planctomycetes bacterium]|nr:hypothetical protein [Planctomycetota bacterium]
MVQLILNLDDKVFQSEAPEHSSGCASCGSGKARSEGSACGNGLEKIYPTTAVRFGYMRYIGEFSHPAGMKFTCGARVVVQTKRGVEIGEQVSLTCSGCSKSVTRDRVKAWVQTCGRDSFIFDGGRILREATSADLAEYVHIQEGAKERRDFCQEAANRLNLPLRIIECECPFGGERIVFYFTAAERVDFRTLVKDLATEYRTRIEMRQVGARDEARLLADYETCGREVCCKVFLKTLKPVSMRMAKLQKATLDPSQVSGRCGRLKCCLRYEHVGYEELDKKLPRMGKRVRTNHGDGVVIARQVLTQLLQIRTDSDEVISVAVEDILIGDAKPVPAVSTNDNGPRPPQSAPREGAPFGRDATRGRTRQEGRSTAAEQEPRTKAEISETTGPKEASSNLQGQEPRRKRRRRRGRRKRPQGDAGSTGSASGPPAGGD